MKHNKNYATQSFKSDKSYSDSEEYIPKKKKKRKEIIVDAADQIVKATKMKKGKKRDKVCESSCDQEKDDFRKEESRKTKEDKSCIEVDSEKPRDKKKNKKRVINEFEEKINERNLKIETEVELETKKEKKSKKKKTIDDMKELKSKGKEKTRTKNKKKKAKHSNQI